MYLESCSSKCEDKACIQGNYSVNYRPISLISNIAKILEKIIHKRSMNFIQTCKIISNSIINMVLLKYRK